MGNPLVGFDGDIYFAASPSVALGAAESCTDSGDHIVYTANVHKWWDMTKTFTVQCSPNGTSGWFTVTDYKVTWAGGVITFDTARVPGVDNFVRINAGSYFNTSQLGDCYSWDLSLQASTQPSTCFQATGGWATNATVTKGGSGKLTSFRYDDALFNELGGNPVGMQLYVDKSANIRWDFFALVETIGPKSQAGTLIEQDAAFVVVGEATLRSS